ncbi:hypothetical protein ACWGNZ_06995 [Sphingomonas zeae]
MIDKARLVADQEYIWRRQQSALSLHQQLVQISLDLSRQTADPVAQAELASRYDDVRAEAVKDGLLQ